jgi:hypothetical protein
MYIQDKRMGLKTAGSKRTLGSTTLHNATHGWVVTKLALYSGGVETACRTEGRMFKGRSFVVILSSSKKIPHEQLKYDHDSFLPHPFQIELLTVRLNKHTTKIRDIIPYSRHHSTDLKTSNHTVLSDDYIR